MMANRGRLTTTRPIPLHVIAKLKDHLSDQPRELAWLTLSTNSAFRGGDVLNILKSDLRPLLGGWMEISVREKKTKKVRVVKLHPDVAKVIMRWVMVHPGKTEYLFEGARGKMGTSPWGVKLREWCAAVGYHERNTSTHSLRKVFVKTNIERGAKLTTLMHALNHASERDTLRYCGIMAEDVEKLYAVAI